MYPTRIAEFEFVIACAIPGADRIPTAATTPELPVALVVVAIIVGGLSSVGLALLVHTGCLSFLCATMIEPAQAYGMPLLRVKGPNGTKRL